MDASRVLGIKGTHVVAPNKFDSASSWPRLAAAIAKNPSLLKDTIWWQNTTIWYRIADEVSDKFPVNNVLDLGFNVFRLGIL
jgi:hypothetical protein